MHDLPLITTVAVAFFAAWLLGLVTQRIGLSPIVGYLLAGVLIGPHTPGFVCDVHIAHQLAEIGVILLMFGVALPGAGAAAAGVPRGSNVASRSAAIGTWSSFTSASAK